MRYVPIRNAGLESSVLGLGCMGMSEFYGAADDAESLRTLERAWDLGVTMYDTSDIYGRGHNEQLVGNLAKGRRDGMVISTKWGIIRDPDGPPGSLYDRTLENSPEYLAQCVDASLKRLGIDQIDLYYIHRHDPDVPIEETIGAMSRLVETGKIRGIGLSEVPADILRRAASVHPIAALQSEYSLWVRDIETDILPLCRELGTVLVAYSPLGRGFLTGAIKDAKTLDKQDLRSNAPRFADGNLDANLAVLERVRELADLKNCTLGQIALAWLFAQGDDIIPIPGTKRIKYLEENVGSVSVALDAAEVQSIGKLISPDAFQGSRYWTAPESQAS